MPGCDDQLRAAAPSSTVTDRAQVDPARSALMSKVRGKDTDPEMRVRRTAHRLGYRFRLHRSDLPGRPDLVFPKLRTAIFVHGCFWHRHASCSRATMPKTRAEFWASKFARNVARDAAAVKALEAANWRVFIIWECETRKAEPLAELLRAQLGPRPRGGDHPRHA